MFGMVPLYLVGAPTQAYDMLAKVDGTCKCKCLGRCGFLEIYNATANDSIRREVIETREYKSSRERNETLYNDPSRDRRYGMVRIKSWLRRIYVDQSMLRERIKKGRPRNTGDDTRKLSLNFQNAWAISTGRLSSNDGLEGQGPISGRLRVERRGAENSAVEQDRDEEEVVLARSQSGDIPAVMVALSLGIRASSTHVAHGNLYAL